MNAWILAIGNELLNGEIVDTNSSFLERELSHYSPSVRRVSILPDDSESIRREIQRALPECSHLFIMGGLGPTEDDLTREAVAGALDRPLALNERELEVLKEKFRLLGRPMSPANARQSFFPERAVVLSNPMGMACGFFLEEKGCKIFVLPGVPSEMKHIFLNEVTPRLRQEFPKKKKEEKLTAKFMGMGEATLDAAIREKIVSSLPLRWEILATGEGVFVKFYPEGGGDGKVWTKELKIILEREFGSLLYAYGEEAMGDAVAGLLTTRSLTFGCVESCTGGYISKYMTDRSGSSRYFVGGLVSYANELKTRLAGVDPELIARHGAVSRETAEAMARGGKEALRSDLCLAVTGVAGPSGGSREKPVGTVWFALMDQRDRVTSTRQLFHGDREDVRRKAVFFGLNLVRLALREGDYGH